ncbi:MAG: Trm112 family protein [Burkholderiales bacterium]|nr:Trm112 family protein [Burkholderiales bacterium]
MDTRLIELLVCPLCKGPLHRLPQGQSLICTADHLAYPIRDGIPVMLESEAQPWEEHDDPIPNAALLTGAASAPQDAGAP